MPDYLIRLLVVSDENSYSRSCASGLNLSWLDFPDDTGQLQMTLEDKNAVGITDFVPKTFPSRPLLFEVNTMWISFFLLLLFAKVNK